MPTPLLDNRQLGGDVQRPNLLVNGGFENWQRGTSFSTSGQWAADRWQLSIGGSSTITISRATAAESGSGGYAVVGAYTHGAAGNYAYLEQSLTTEILPQIKGKTVSLSVRAYGGVNYAPGCAQVALTSSGAASNIDARGTMTTVGPQTLTATATVPSDATGLVIRLFWVNISSTTYWDNASLVVGSVPAAADPQGWQPMHPADDLARCKRYYQRWQSGQGNTYLGVGSAQSATVGYAMFGPWPVTLAVTPTLTISAAADFVVVNKSLATSWPVTGVTMPVPYASLAGPILLSMTIGTSSLTPGDQIYFVANTTTAWLALEANP